MTNTQTRVLSAVIFIPVPLILLIIGGFAWGVLIAIAAGIGAYEYYKMGLARGYKPQTVAGVAASVVLCLGLGLGWPMIGLGIAALAVLAMAALEVRRQNPSGSIANMAVGVFGLIYVGGFLSHAVLIRNYLETDAEGIFFMLIALAASMLCDTGAYFVGRAYGRRKLIPGVSPGKTVEGTLGGIASGIITVCVIKLIAGIFMEVPFGWGLAILLGGLITIAGVIGDLVESMMKRDAGVKDSGNVIPGHGGLMDRLDALLWAVPATYYFAIWVAA